MSFDSEKAKNFLATREQQEKEKAEEERKKLLKQVLAILKKEFQNTSIEIYLVGSITRPFSFTSHSDVDIVLKNYQGDRFEIWTKLEKQIGRDVEIILFETCSFQEFVLKEGLKVL